MEFIFLVLFLASRLLFANAGNVFFDSKEYLLRWAEPNLWVALTSGHTPLHDGYVLTFWPIFQIASKFIDKPENVVILCQILMSVGIMYYFYKIVAILFSKVTAIKSSILLTLIPLFWISNGTVMMETTYLFYWIASIYSLLIYLKGESSIRYLGISGVFWSMAFLTHTVVILWIPFVLLLAWIINKKKFKTVVVCGFTILVCVSTLNAYLLSQGAEQSLWLGFYQLYGAKFGEHAQITSASLTLIRYLRNWVVPTFYNNNGLLLLFSLAGFIYLLKKDKKYALLFFLWIVPTLITNQWWDSLFYGRHGLISIFALTALAALVSKKRLFLLLVVYLAYCSFFSLTLLKKDTPYLSMLPEINKLYPGGFLIESHFSRPQTNGEFFGEIFFVGEPGYDETKLAKKIDSYFVKNKPVFITGQALSEPYGLFNGPYLHSLTLSYKQPYLLKEILKDYSFIEQDVIDKGNNLIIYRILKTPGEYPKVLTLNNSARRLDSLDFISKQVLQLFSYSK